VAVFVGGGGHPVGQGLVLAGESCEPGHQEGGRGEVTGSGVAVVDLYCQDIGAVAETGEVLAAEGEAGWGAPGRALRLGIAVDGEAIPGGAVGGSHVGAGDLRAIEVGHETVVIVHIEQDRQDGRRIGDLEGVAHVEGVHSRYHGGVVVVAIADAAGAFLP